MFRTLFTSAVLIAGSTVLASSPNARFLDDKGHYHPEWDNSSRVTNVAPETAKVTNTDEAQTASATLAPDAAPTTQPQVSEAKADHTAACCSDEKGHFRPERANGSMLCPKCKM